MTYQQHQKTAEGALLESLDRSMGIVEFSMDGAILRANRNFLDMCGYDAEELIGQNHKLLCTTEFIISDAYHDFWRTLRQGNYMSGLYIRQRKDGKRFWVEATYNPVYSADDTPDKIVKICTDVTARNEGINENTIKLDAIDRTMLQVEYSPQGLITDFNENFITAFSYVKSDLVGKNNAVLAVDEAGEAQVRSLWERVRAGHTFSGRVAQKASDGRTVWLESTYIPVFNLSGKMTKVIQFASDISERIRHERSEQEQMRLLSLVADETGNAVVIVDRFHKTLYVNAGFTRMFGYTLEELKDRLPTVIFGPREQRVVAGMREAFTASDSFRTEELTFSKSGQRLWCSVLSNRITDGEGAFFGTISVYTDVTDTKVRAVLQDKALEAMAHDVPTADILTLVCEEAERIMPEVIVTVSGVDRSGRLFPMAGPSRPEGTAEALSGFSLDLDGSPRNRLLKQGRAFAITDFEADGDIPFDRKAFLKAGIRACYINPILSPAGELIGVVAFYSHEKGEPDDFKKQLGEVLVRICSLAMEREEARLAMRKLSFYDSLTELPNRELLLAKADRMVTAQAGRSLAVLVVNVDRFKRINDSLGHSAGDSVLKMVAGVLNDKDYSGLIAGRITGDEFAVILPECDATHAATWAKRFQERIAHPCEKEALIFIPTVSVGISMYPVNGDDIETLLANASIALGVAKETGAGQVRFFSDELDNLAKDQLSIESALRIAVEEKSLDLYYQPQVLLQKSGLHGVEALSRWCSVEFGQVPPSTFIPLAEESDLIDRLGEWTLAEGCRQMGEWRKRGIMVPTVSINLSSLSFLQASLPERLVRHLAEHELPPECLIVELTESVLVDGGPVSLETIFAAHRHGIRFSMDDFGTGYSSLSYLRRLPVEELKLDQSFVRDLETDVTGRRLSQAVASMGKSLGLTLVAEGVETVQQSEILARQGYDAAQGYLHAKALPAREFEDWYALFLASERNTAEE